MKNQTAHVPAAATSGVLYSPSGVRIRITSTSAWRSDGTAWDLIPGEASVLREVLLAQGWREV